MAEAFGSNQYTDGPYGGYDNPPFPTGIGTTIELYDNTLARKLTFQTGSGDFIGVQFTVDESGSRDFILFFAAPQIIEKKDIIKIRLFNSDDYFFTGVVRAVPIEGSTKAEYNYGGFGLNDYLIRMNAGPLSYSAKTLDYILNDIADNVIVVKSPIIKNAAKIVPPDITIDFDINYSQIPEVLNAIKQIANSDGQYVTGVDQEGEFFFREKSQEIKKFLAVGKTGRNNINDYQPEDQTQIRTKYYLLDKDGAYISTISSTEDNDIFEEKLVAPDIDNATAIKWAEGILAENETLTRRATIKWKIENSAPLVLMADGNLRIHSETPPTDIAAPNPNPYGSGTYGSGLYGGGQPTWKVLDDTLQVKEVTYTLTGKEATRTIELGSLPVRLDETIITVNKKLTDLQISLGR